MSVSRSATQVAEAACYRRQSAEALNITGEVRYEFLVDSGSSDYGRRADKRRGAVRHDMVGHAPDAAAVTASV